MEVYLTARLGASRLPRKHLLPVVGERVTVKLLVERLRSTGLPVVGVIPEGGDDDALEEILRRSGADVFRGDEENVLLRYAQAMRSRGADRAIIVDGDDFFVSLSAIRAIAREADAADLIRVDGLPFGGAPYLMALSAVEDLLAKLTTTSGWGYHLDGLDCRQLRLRDDRFTDEERAYRLTLDYEEDCGLLKMVYSRIYAGRPLGLADAVREITAHRGEYVAAFPEIFDGTIDEKYRRHLGR